MGVVIGAVAVVFVLALIIFPGVRGKLKVLVGGFLNIFVEDIAKTPEGAKAVFQQAIEEVQERYNKAGDTLNRFVGEQSSVQKNLNKLYGELKDVESKCESLVRSGNMADAAIFSTRREEILFEISQKEGYLRELEPMVKEAQTVYEAYDKKLRELKKQSRMTVEEMKLRGNMKDLLGDLDELRRDSATDKLLGSVRDGAEDLRKEVVRLSFTQAVPPPKCQWLRKMRRKLSRMLTCSLSPQSIAGSRLYRLHGLASPSTLLNPK